MTIFDQFYTKYTKSGLYERVFNKKLPVKTGISKILGWLIPCPYHDLVYSPRDDEEVGP